MVSVEAVADGPSSSELKAAIAPKRKRPDSLVDELEDDESAGQKKQKVKARRACLSCQRAHLTCDDVRPCTRCQQRCIECVEGHRKKAKYLQGEDDMDQVKNTPVVADNHKVLPTITPALLPVVQPPPPPTNVPNTQDPSGLFDPNYPFGSEVVNLEYSILSAILGSPPDSSTSPSATAYSGWSQPEVLPFVQPTYTSGFSQNSTLPLQTIEPVPNSNSFLAYPMREPRSLQDLQYRSQQETDELHPLQPRFPLDLRPRSPPTPAFLESPRNQLLSSNAYMSSAFLPGPKSSSFYDKVTEPYQYTEGYHFLMQHLRSRFEKYDILRIVRALAIFRPSLIALQMPLSRDDEVFLEKCLQRSLLELEKLISFSGTPTVVWRRTGEICLVAPEFCTLTEWHKEELVVSGRKKYIYELFENQSVVEYWENFASHAFENTTQSVFSHCVLLKPSGAPVPCTFCFSIRRDVFDLPSLVIGQWLPLL